MTTEQHWGLASHGERVRHPGEKDDCTEDNCPKGQATTPEGRVRLLMAILEEREWEALGWAVVCDERFKTETWPRKSYALLRGDVQDVLYSLDMAREIRDSNADRIDEARGESSEFIKVLSEMSKQIEAKDKEIARLEGTVASLRRHGGEHWFAYGYQKITNVMLGHWVDFCKVCDKPKDDPSHFGNGTKALSSEAVEEAVQIATGRVTALLEEGLRMGKETAHLTSLELMRGLPGVPE